MPLAGGGGLGVGRLSGAGKETVMPELRGALGGCPGGAHGWADDGRSSDSEEH